MQLITSSPNIYDNIHIKWLQCLNIRERKTQRQRNTPHLNKSVFLFSSVFLNMNSALKQFVRRPHRIKIAVISIHSTIKHKKFVSIALSRSLSLSLPFSFSLCLFRFVFIEIIVPLRKRCWKSPPYISHASQAGFNNS